MFFRAYPDISKRNTLRSVRSERGGWGIRLATCSVIVLTMAMPIRAEACPVMLMGFATSAAGTITSVLSSMGLAFGNSYIRFVDALTRLANQDSNNMDKRSKLFTSMADTERNAAQAVSISTIRTNAAEQFIPSRVVCGLISNQLRVSATSAYYTQTRRNMAKTGTYRSLNADGTGTEMGSVQATSTVFKNRCSRYANVADLRIPAGLTCAGPANPDMIDRDIQPMRAIFNPLNLDTAETKQAAEDSIMMLIEPIPPDPVRGPMLSRQEGKNAAVLRLRDVTRMNIARAALEDIVSMRYTSEACTTGDNSRLARYVELATGRQVKGNLVTTLDEDIKAGSSYVDLISSAGDSENANVQSIMARMAAQKMMLAELLRLTDHIITVDAVSLAIETETTRVSSPGVASQAVNN